MDKNQKKAKDGMLHEQYYRKLMKLMAEAYEAEKGKIEQAAEMMADCIAQGGLVYAFGCGHSHMLAEEMFYRAGGLVPVSAMLMEEVMLHEGAVRSSNLECREGNTPRLLDEYGVTKKDILLVFSTSGVNGAPVDLALKAQEKGIRVISITSMDYQDHESHHSSGKHLYQASDLFLDNHVPSGDALVQIQGSEKRTAPASTAISAMLIECLVAQTAENLSRMGIDPPVFCSGNVPGGKEKNLHYIQKYRDRVKHLDPTEEAGR